MDMEVISVCNSTKDKTRNKPNKSKTKQASANDRIDIIVPCAKKYSRDALEQDIPDTAREVSEPRVLNRSGYFLMSLVEKWQY